MSISPCTLRTASLLAALSLAGASSLAGVFSNTDGISIPNSGTSTPYPSLLTVSGEGGILTGITVTLTDYQHTFSPDVAIVLQGPGGENVMLMGAVGGEDVPPVDLTFDDDAPTAPVSGTPLVSGSYLPADSTGGSYTFSDAGAYAEPASWTTTLGTFNGTNPNGVWKLFVQDFAGGDSGSIASWSVNITSVPEPGTYAAVGAAALVGFALARRRFARR